MQRSRDGEMHRYRRLQVNYQFPVNDTELMVRTMDLFKARLTRNRRRCVLVQGAPVTSEIELLVDVDLLVSEDFQEKSAPNAVA